MEKKKIQTITQALVNRWLTWCLFVFSSDVHMYMGQPPVYNTAPGSMPPAEVQLYQNPASGQPGMAQTPSYSTPATQSLPNHTDTQQNPYPEKALL